jgi:ribosomal protein S20
MRTAIKRFRLLVESDPAAAGAALPGTCGMIDHAATLGAIHANAAARTKSRLTRALAAKTSA